MEYFENNKKRYPVSPRGYTCNKERGALHHESTQECVSVSFLLRAGVLSAHPQTACVGFFAVERVWKLHEDTVES